MPGALTDAHVHDDVVRRLVEFDRDELPALTTMRDPWALAEPSRSGADALIGAWVSARAPGQSYESLVLEACGDGLHALAACSAAYADGALGAVAKSVYARDDVPRTAGEELHVALIGATLLGDDARFLEAHVSADLLLDRFERRKHPMGLTGHGDDAVDLLAAGLLRSTWRVLSELTGDPRFLNGALKLGEWTRQTLPDPFADALRPWHGLRRLVTAGGHDLSLAATALHLRCVERERHAVRRMRWES